ncbi:hypothetical protein I6F35_07800 [Bradyrhizobium sp. BRP22]|uniref:hypothetical protein n=1 Tax=Bradyrhizobium sp. BRP22 TaxID=2793821 RepID=UPI001CD4CD33|nr:hypothetical protein [Bradyrhizobium sp. BRP22]MCA1453123.1 hypothetical protein [Bradyrhizobium sp. BRP22]
MPMTSAAETCGRAPSESHWSDGLAMVRLVAASTQTAWYASRWGLMTITQCRFAEYGTRKLK